MPSDSDEEILCLNDSTDRSIWLSWNPLTNCVQLRFRSITLANGCLSPRLEVRVN